MALVVLQAEDRRGEPLLEACMAQNARVCAARGWTHRCVRDSKQYATTMPPYWWKVFLLRDCLHEVAPGTLVQWLDSDAYLLPGGGLWDPVTIASRITGPGPGTTSPPACAWVGGDPPSLPRVVFNAGSFLVRSDEHGRRLVDEWCRCYRDTHWRRDPATGRWSCGSSRLLPCVWAGAQYEQGAFVRRFCPGPSSSSSPTTGWLCVTVCVCVCMHTRMWRGCMEAWSRRERAKWGIQVLPWYVFNEVDGVRPHRLAVSVHLMAMYRRGRVAPDVQRGWQPWCPACSLTPFYWWTELLVLLVLVLVVPVIVLVVKLCSSSRRGGVGRPTTSVVRR